MEVLLVRAAVPFPCSRRSQKSGEPLEKARAQKLLTSSPTENSTNPSTVATSATSASSSSSNNTSRSALVPLPAFPLKFPWFKAAGGKKDVDVARDVASLALSTAHDEVVTNLGLSDEEKRTVHEVLSTLQSSPTALEVIKPLVGSDDSTVELAKAEAEIAKSWLHNFMRIRSLWNIRQFNTAPRKQQSPNKPPVIDPCPPTIEEGRDVVESVVGDDAMSCVCEECSVDTEDEKTTAPGGEDETKEIAHVKIVHDRASFSKFLQSVPVAELKTVSHLSFLSNLAYSIPSIKVSELVMLRKDFNLVCFVDEYTWD